MRENELKHKFKEIRITVRNKIKSMREKYKQFVQHLEEGKILRQKYEYYDK